MYLVAQASVEVEVEVEVEDVAAGLAQYDPE
jgi:hypothetical protein